MVVAVTGGTGTVGKRVVQELADRGHEVRQLSRRAPAEIMPGAAHYSIDLTTGAGLDRALCGVDVVVDAAQSTGSFRRARDVLVGGTARLSAVAGAAGVGHHVLCSIVGIEDVPSAYYRAKVAQEAIVTAGQTPWSIVRATQFYELLDRIFSLSARAGVLPGAAFSLQPIDARTVARALTDAAERGPSQARVEIAGPEMLPVSQLARAWRRATGRRAVLVPVPTIGEVGRGLRRGALTSSGAAAPDSPTFEQWLRSQYGSAGDGASARPGARPLPGRRLPAGKVTGRLSVVLQQTLTRLAPSSRRSAELGRSPYTLLSTFRRDGTAVAVPVWAAMDNGRLYVRSERAAGKVKRLARTGRAVVAPCDAVGRALAPGSAARGRILAADEEPTAERALARRYGAVREAFERTVDLMRIDMCYLELTPDTHAEPAGSDREPGERSPNP